MAAAFRIELLPDSERATGRWLMVGGSEQSFVDTADPEHLEFEYVQIIADVVSATFAANTKLTVLHLGGGLCTLPRWIAVRHPGSAQRVAEASPQIAKLCRSLGLPSGVRLVVKDAADVAARARRHSADLIVCDIYDGPDTVTKMFTLDALQRLADVLRPGGLFVCNLSDAAPFALSRVVVATLRKVFGNVILLAEPPVLRGRRSGNLVLAATDAEIPMRDLVRRASSGIVRARVMVDEEIGAFVGEAEPAHDVEQLPASGESGDRHLAKF